jgi:hypothetical protein
VYKIVFYKYVPCVNEDSKSLLRSVSFSRFQALGYFCGANFLSVDDKAPLDCFWENVG